MKLKLTRDVFSESFTLGVLTSDGVHIGYTCEDPDRKMEVNGMKIYGKTAIPRGAYKVGITFSHRFQKNLPQVFDVPGFEGIRIHGGNTAEDTLGCPLLGLQRTCDGVAKCKEVNDRLILMIERAEELGEPVTLEVV
jgi:hypothetical protein